MGVIRFFWHTPLAKILIIVNPIENYNVFSIPVLFDISFLISINLKFYTCKLFVLSLPFQMITIIASLSFIIDVICNIAFILIIIYYEHLRIDSINRIINNSVNRHKSIHHLVKRFSEEHNQFCTHIWNLNIWMKNIYIATMLCCFPMNLLAMHQLFFEQLDELVIVFGTIILVINNFVVFMLQFIFALLSKKIHRMLVKLSLLQWSLNGYPFRMRSKMKLLMCLERLSAKRKIGFTIAGTAMTFPLFSQVCVDQCWK